MIPWQDYDTVVSRGSERQCLTSEKHPDRILKVSRKDSSVQTVREIAYFEYLKRKGVDADFMPAYFGSFETDELIGFEQAKVAGEAVCRLDEFICSASAERLAWLQKKLLAFKEEMIRTNIIVSDLHPANLFFDGGSGRIWVVDGYGSSEFIPAPQYIRFFGRLKIGRQWKKFAERMKGRAGFDWKL